MKYQNVPFFTLCPKEGPTADIMAAFRYKWILLDPEVGWPFLKQHENPLKNVTDNVF